MRLNIRCDRIKIIFLETKHSPSLGNWIVDETLVDTGGHLLQINHRFCLFVTNLIWSVKIHYNIYIFQIKLLKNWISKFF